MSTRVGWVVMGREEKGRLEVDAQLVNVKPGDERGKWVDASEDTDSKGSICEFVNDFTTDDCTTKRN